jgi:hypothetical protein
MAKQYSDTLRNAWIASIESTLGTTPKTRIYTGSPPATVATAASGTLLWEGTGASDWLTAPSGGSASLSGSFAGTVAADGTAGYYRMTTSGGTAHEQGIITRAFSTTTSASTAANSNVLTVTSNAGVTAGMSVSGTGIPTGATVLSTSGSTSVTISVPSTAGVSNGVTVYFGDTSGDLWLNNTTLSSGQSLSITVYTRTAPGA